MYVVRTCLASNKHVTSDLNVPATRVNLGHDSSADDSLVIKNGDSLTYSRIPWKISRNNKFSLIFFYFL
jgi:hypothetical protein